MSTDEYKALSLDAQAEYDSYLWDLAYDIYLDAKAESEAQYEPENWNPTSRPSSFLLRNSEAVYA